MGPLPAPGEEWCGAGQYYEMTTVGLAGHSGVIEK